MQVRLTFALNKLSTLPTTLLSNEMFVPVCSTLIPKANAWLQENQYVYLVKCETLEKKVSTVDEVTSDECMFIPKNHNAIYVKGLR